ncbi:hypothetical protein RirG_062160 [Rhizophagus irregularis DAOM 197198w]|uniref:Uncharacterized protein n=1 Tax=Rhizophagus irregularis (strain DAOM 197198w) TaxID=1432141 RepID=A0A015K0S5_RHIIW|nr:hypothetical protein RirG_062160 [Rhizophagus irregularis DAOM 197198w]
MSSIIELSDIEEYNAEDFADVAKIVNKDKDRDDINEDKSEDDENNGTVAFFTSKLQVPKIIYTTVPVEYPETSLEGVATIYNVTGWKNHMDAFSDIQYSTNGSGGSSNIKECPFFGGISIKKDKRMCQGIKFCQFTDQEFVNQEHCSVDFDSETFIFINIINSKTLIPKKLKHTLKESSCPFKKENIPCDGRALTYFIGCDKFKQGDQWHRFIKIKPEEIDISLLQNLFSGTASVSVRNGKLCKKCDIPHLNNGTAVRGDIIEKSCLVQFIKIIPHNIAKCPFVALICIGAIYQDDTTTSRSIISGNLIKAYFNKDILAEVHVSLNNIDKLRYLIGKAYKNLHPFGQGVMGIYHNVLTANSNLSNYVHKIGKLIALEWFQIDVSFKRVKGEINKFEINTYDSNHHLILSFCRVFTNVFTAEGYHRLFSSLFQVIYEISGQHIKFQHIHKEGIGCILADLDNAQAKAFEKNTKNLIRQIPNTSSKDELKYYKQPYVLSSLNQFISNIDYEIWRKSGGNTNNAEAAHFMVNREGKQLKLLSAILRGKRYDERCYKTIEIHNKAGVSYTHIDKSEIKRTCGSITRKGFHNQKNKESVIDLTNDKLSNKSSLKRKLSPSTNRKSSKKSRKEPSENDNEILEL